MDAKNTVGVILIGTFIAALLSGTVSMQTIFYFRTYTDDSRRNRAMVAAIWVIDALHTILACIAVWFYVIVSWGDNTIGDYIPWPIAGTITATGITTFIVQSFFTHRIYILSNGCLTSTVPTYLFALLRMVTTLVSTAKMTDLHSYSAYITQYGWCFTLGLSLSSLVDIVVTGALIFVLQRNRTGYSTSTDRLIDFIVIYTIETGLLTCVMAIACLICWLVFPSNLVFLTLHFTISKLYANSLLATLNARNSLRDRALRSHTCASEIGAVAPGSDHHRYDNDDRSIEFYLAAHLNGKRDSANACDIGDQTINEVGRYRMSGAEPGGS